MDSLEDPRLPLGRYRLGFEVETPPEPTDFPGSAWRGALGYSLRRTLCVTRQPDCPACLLYRSCLFPYFWDTPPPPNAAKMRRYTNAPHPFVLRPDPEAAGCHYSLELILIGQANPHLPVLVHALGQAAQGPRGIRHSAMQLVRIEQETPLASGYWQVLDGPSQATFPPALAWPPAPAACRVQIRMPLRIRREGQPLGPDAFRFADLFGSLLRRVSMLTAFHTPTPLETDFRGLMDRAARVTCRTDLAWRELSRWSARQQAVQRMGGLIGTLDLTDTDLTPFWPYLWLGQWVHAGSGATMGLGWYLLAPSGAGEAA